MHSLGAELVIHEAKKPRIAQVTALNFIEPQYIIELIYDSKTRGCKTPQHTQKLFDRLYVILCKKTLDWHYFHKIFMDPASRVDLPPHTQQQYYVHYCHKICGDCLQKSSRCPVCENIENLDFSKHTKYIYDTCITKDIEINSLQDFHDTFQKLQFFLQKKSEKKCLFHT